MSLQQIFCDFRVEVSGLTGEVGVVLAYGWMLGSSVEEGREEVNEVWLPGSLRE